MARCGPLASRFPRWRSPWSERRQHRVIRRAIDPGHFVPAAHLAAAAHAIDMVVLCAARPPCCTGACSLPSWRRSTRAGDHAPRRREAGQRLRQRDRPQRRHRRRPHARRFCGHRRRAAAEDRASSSGSRSCRSNLTLAIDTSGSVQQGHDARRPTRRAALSMPSCARRTR